MGESPCLLPSINDQPFVLAERGTVRHALNTDVQSHQAGQKNQPSKQRATLLPWQPSWERRNPGNPALKPMMWSCWGHFWDPSNPSLSGRKAWGPLLSLIKLPECPSLSRFCFACVFEHLHIFLSKSTVWRSTVENLRMYCCFYSNFYFNFKNLFKE